jgi:hypothetical protein
LHPADASAQRSDEEERNDNSQLIAVPSVQAEPGKTGCCSRVPIVSHQLSPHEPACASSPARSPCDWRSACHLERGASHLAPTVNCIPRTPSVRAGQSGSAVRTAPNRSGQQVEVTSFSPRSRSSTFSPSEMCTFEHPPRIPAGKRHVRRHPRVRSQRSRAYEGRGARSPSSSSLVPEP